MSRCFSYPPPGYVRDEVMMELSKALIEQSKEKKRVKERREKKGEKEVKKEKSKEHRNKDEKKRKREKSHKDESSNQGLVEDLKKRDSDSEHLEKSGLTEEHGLPCSAQYSPDSDSTQKIAKRNKTSASETGHLNNHVANLKTGSVLIIRLPSIKRKHLEPPCEDEPSTSCRAEPTFESASCRTKTTIERGEPSTSRRAEATLQRTEPSTSCMAEATLQTRAPSTDYRAESKMEAEYANLINKWQPPPMQFECTEPEDLDWLLGTKQQQHNQQALKRCGSSELTSATGSGKTITPCWPPRACYLPEAGIYALPYTVPF
ncbi:hypothetical protein QJS10_CPB15g00414 [Acorus calamus]|uniref:Uncharacterized protein n=1 Tax=Acorus calamus TaxID=4465 RepID=A0AAV9D4M3_ACOCL|nr:hypothetical protein QJS10_CPB15g00414 [Acorus calamus]